MQAIATSPSNLATYLHHAACRSLPESPKGDSNPSRGTGVKMPKGEEKSGGGQREGQRDPRHPTPPRLIFLERASRAVARRLLSRITSNPG